MGKHKKTTKGRSDAQKGISPTPSSHADETGNTGDVVCDLRDEVALLEEALSQMGTSSKMAFHFAWCGRSLSELFYHLSMDKVTQHMKVRHAIASTLEWL